MWCNVREIYEKKFVVHYRGQPVTLFISKTSHAAYQLIFYLKVFENLLFSRMILKLSHNFGGSAHFLIKSEGA